MNDPKNKLGQYAGLEQLSTQALEDLLQQDFAAGEDHSNPDLVMAIMEVMEQRTPQAAPAVDVDAAWNAFRAGKIAPMEPEAEAAGPLPEVAPVPPSAAPQKPRRRKAPRRALAVAAVVCVLVCLSILPVQGSSLLQNLVQWSDANFSFLSREPDGTEAVLRYSRDCTNFVSQCLYAGGLSQDSTWKSIPNWHGNTVVRVDSTQWVNANSLKEYLKTSGRGTKIGSWSLKGSPSPYLTFAYVNDSSNLSSSRTGKVVLFYDWESDGTMNHSAFFVANNGKSTLSGEGYGDLINQHTENRKQVLWRPDNRQNSTQKATTRVYAFEIKA